ncbi:ribose-5-phosphate isomerase RpiA [Bacillus sp. UMB0893]|uniref:ribose-5-phosphate isomerase RpiA n=1 Tax=Bacillus sp. UMB0893 TaxID=2066053 RepID=UPI000C77E4AB|nr:ribose-5-phosphate isomerase RpiA [Bacillus sp. UMB0893]PLR68675.1 ribose 5-phosphate isomerase A [Bacillus sp. UMB0893]
MNEKKLVGEKAAEFVKDGMIVGLGTGSTVYYTLEKLGQLVKEGLQMKGIPTSAATEKLAHEFGIPLTSFLEAAYIDVAIDGADEVDAHLNLIKGGGGALLREKIIASAADTFIVVADSTKMSEQLGSFRLPVEVLPFGNEITEKKIRTLGCLPELRLLNSNPYKTDNGNLIFDCAFAKIMEPKEVERNLNMIPGVVENGLFVGIADMAITLNAENKIMIHKR